MRLLRRVAASAAALALAGAGPALAQEVGGRVRQTFQRLGDGEDASRSLLQNYEISFRSPITRQLFWQARMRALVAGFDGEDRQGGDNILSEPFLQVVFDNDAWQLSGGGRLTRIEPRGSASGVPETEREDLFAHAAWSPEGMPRVEWSGYRINLQDQQVETTTEDRSLLSASWGREAGSLGLSLENRWLTDHRTDFTRDSIQATANGDVRVSLAGGRVMLGGQALVVQGRVDERTPRALEVDVFRRPRTGLFADDPTPMMGLLADTPALIDGDIAAPAADLSGDFRNVGVDFGFDQTVDMALLFLERRLQAGHESDYAFDVYRSEDGDLWELVQASASLRFDLLQNRFEIRFPGTTTRWIKVVNTRFSSDEPPLAVTEIQVSGLETRSGRDTLGQSLQSGNVSAVWRATGMLDVAFTAFANRQSTDGAGEVERSDADLDSTLSATLRRGITSTTVRLQAINRSSSPGLPESDRIAAVTFAVKPLPALDLSATGTHRRDSHRDTLRAASDSLTLRAAGALARHTEAALDLGLVHQNDVPIRRTTTRRRAHLSLVTTLRPGLFLVNSWDVERLLFFGPGSGTSPDRTDLDLRSRVAWRPTPVVGAEVEVLYQAIAGFSGYSRLYDLDWLPFPGGSLQVQLGFRQDRRSVTGDLREESRAGVRWTLNPRTLVDVAYASIRSGQSTSARQKSVSAFLEYRF
ncbi:MAG TPA: hypothetical protein VJV23_01040 [Candidatus Polarisedimenticolia bacterium]|nr:hypothetical protein [Candidatus Polarisedimenticolia bacterium]